MAEENAQEYTDNPEGDKEVSRQLISEIAQHQLEALGYRDTLDKFKKWVKESDGKPEIVGRLYSKTGVETNEPFTISAGDKLEALLHEIKRIPDKSQARKLVSAALFGIPFSQDMSGVVIVSYYMEEPSNKTIQTEFNPNRDSKDMIRVVPNVAGSRILAGRVANTGFIPKGQNPIDVIRKLSWGARVFEGTNQDDPSIQMRITPTGTAFQVQVHKSL